MIEFIKILKFLLKDTYRASKAERGAGRVGVYVIIALLYLFFEFAVITSLIGLAPQFSEANMIPEFLTTVMVLGLAAVTALGIMPMLSLLYFSKDSEFFLSLPVSSSKIYFAKLTTVYITQLAITAAILLPTLYAIGIVIGLNWSFFLVMILAILLLPLFPLMAISIICLPLMYLIRFFKNRGAVASIVTMILFVAMFAAYWLLVGSASDVPVSDEEFVKMISDQMQRIATVFFPFTAINRFATFTKLEGHGEAVSLLLNFFIFVVPALIMSGITLVISRKAYFHAVSSQLENSKHNRGGSLYQERTSTLKALMLKEWKGIIRTPIFTLQCFGGLIIAPIMLIVIGISSVDIATEDASIGICLNWFTIAMMIQMVVVCLNVGASTAFSRDGNAFYLNKFLPLPYDTQIKAKIRLFNIIYGADITLCFVIELFILGLEFWWVGLLLYLYILIINYGFINLCLILDLSKPKLDWKSYREIVKNSRNAMLPMLIGFAISIVLGLLSIVMVLILSGLINIRLAAIFTLVLLLGASIAFAFVTRNILHTNAKRYFERIEA